MSTNTGIFGRYDENGNVVLFQEDGSVVTRLNLPALPIVWNVYTGTSSHYENPYGLVLSAEVFEWFGKVLGIEIGDDHVVRYKEGDVYYQYSNAMEIE